MKKIVLFLICFVLASTAYAQKTTVAVGEVTGGSGAGSEQITALRTKIINGLAAFPRLNVVDVKNLGLSVSNVGIEDLQKNGVDNLVSANIESITTGSSTTDGKTRYEAKMKYSVTVVDVHTGQVVGTLTKTRYGSSSTGTNDAKNDLFGLITSDMKELVENNFRVVASFVAIDESNARKGAVTVYIQAGTNQGITKGMLFEVYKIVEVAGEQVEKKIGEVKCNEISGEALSLCKVTKGGKEIQAAYDDELQLIVISKPGLLTTVGSIL